MAVDDIFHARMHFENPTGAGSLGYYYKETEATTDEDPCRTIADRIHWVMGDEVLAVLSDDWYWAGIEVSKVHGDPRPMYLRETKDAGGLSAGKIAGPGLPANNSIQFNLFQDTFGAQHHGRVNMPGIPESKASGGRLDTAYLVTEVAALAAVLLPLIGGLLDGIWVPGVISAKRRDVAPPAKDWVAAFAPITSIEATSIISRQRRRTTKARGFATAF